MAAHVPDVGRPHAVSLISGGKSNLTYLLETTSGEGPGGGRRLVLRRPPLGHVLPTAHDMRREWRVISALASTPVPVPEPVAFCADEEVLGAPFYLMGHVDGMAVRDPETSAALRPEAARRLSERLAEVLAEIHTVDYQAIGLGDFGRPEGYMTRQMDRWHQQWTRSRTRDVPGYETLAARLCERLPARSAAGLVHGDYRLDNTLVRLLPDPDIVAVVDWEMSTLGDPLADLGMTLTYWQDPGDDERARLPIVPEVTVAPGFFTAKEFVAHYAEASGADLTDLDFYVAFGHYKLAVIAEGIYTRFKLGKTVGEGFEQAGETAPLLIERAHRMLEA